MSNFWVINRSNLKKGEKSTKKDEKYVDALLDIMIKEHICLFGYFDSSGKTFRKIKIGDVIIVSQRSSEKSYQRSPDSNYFVGIVSSKAYCVKIKVEENKIESLEDDIDLQNIDKNDIFQARKLKNFKLLKGKKLTFKEDNEDYQTVQPIYKLKKSNDKDKILIEEIKKIMDINMIKECKELLEQNYNLILTGAPGTGKTYLAKEIAKEIMKNNENIKDYKEFIREYYNKNKEGLDDLKKQGDKLREGFINKFPIESLKNISIDDYAIGRGDNNSFCYWIEFGLDRKLLDNFSIGGSTSYILYYDKETGNLVNKIGKDDNEVIKEIGKELYNMATIEDYDFKDSIIDFNKRNQYLAIKIYNTYHPYTYFPMMSNKDMLSICDIFSIEKDDNIYKLNKNIKKFFDENFKDIDLYIIKIILLENIDLISGKNKI